MRRTDRRWMAVAGICAAALTLGACGRNEEMDLDDAYRLAGAMMGQSSESQEEDVLKDITLVEEEDGTWRVEWSVLTAKEIVVPATYQGKEVTVVGTFNEYLETIELPDTIRCIRHQAFFPCRQLRSVKLGTSVETIEFKAFQNCSQLTAIELPESLTDMGEYCFADSGLTEITIPSGVTELPFSCFSNTALTEVTVPGNVTHIRSFCFSECGELQVCTIEEGVQMLDIGIFENCPKLTDVYVPASVTEIEPEFYNPDTLPFTMHVKAGSAAEKYAVEKGIDYVTE